MSALAFVVALAAVQAADAAPSDAAPSDAAPADAPAVPPPDAPSPVAEEPPAPERHATVAAADAISLRFGMLADGGGTAGRTLLAPYAGLGYGHWLGRVIGVGARYDLTSTTRGTSEAAVTRLGQRFSATVDARWLFGPTFSLHGGVGGGASWLLSFISAGDAAQTFGRTDGMFVWHASFDVHLPDSPVGVTLGASGFIGSAVQTAGFVGVEILLGGGGGGEKATATAAPASASGAASSSAGRATLTSP